LKLHKYPFQKQYDTADCGPACLKMLAAFYGKNYSLEYLREQCFLTREGVSLLSINDAAEQIGFRTFMTKLNFDVLVNDCPLPCIIHWNQDHFVVLYKVRSSGKKISFTLADPAHGIVTIDQVTFKRSWVSTPEESGVALVLEPTPVFHDTKHTSISKSGYGFLFRYLRSFKGYILQLAIGMIAASLITMIFPILAQLLIDKGVNEKNSSIVFLILISQLFLFLGNTIITVVRSWLLLHVNTRISLNIISDFLIKLLKLPIKYFDSKTVGDLSQRINDHHRIENFLTGESLSTFFSLINIAVFMCLLAYYNFKILIVFLTLSVFGILWILLFQNKRMHLDYKRFARGRENQDKLFEMITGMQEIKLYGSESAKRFEWEQMQVKYFKLNMSSLALEQYQQVGFVFFSHLKNIIISFIAANAVISNQMTIGGLLSISFIVGQTNGPLDQLVTFFKSAQDARLSMNRLQEIHNKTNEEDAGKIQTSIYEDINLNNLSFQYEGPNSPFVLKDIDVQIPKGKITAIVGTSGSGKTTLMKLLLQFYDPVNGAIRVGDTNLSDMSPRHWRTQCGSVMQEGYIFHDTIVRNIALDGNEIDETRLQNALNVANLNEFISGLPLGYTTKIGSSGVGISGGQKQRILIARAIYKNPNYLFFDEATSSLDANNEKIIMENLNRFFKGKTVLIIAHRLSTVKNADQIIVLENGNVAEVGNHETLVNARSKYFELVKNQLELGE